MIWRYQKIKTYKELYNQKMSITQIAKLFTKSRSYIYNMLKQANTKFRTISESKSKELHHNWKGGKHKDARGRVFLANGTKKGILESRAVWIKHNGQIPKGHVIHHINHNPSDNCIDNLQLLSINKHVSYHNKIRGKINRYEVNKVVKYDDAVKAQCVEKAKEGMSLAAICKELGPNPKAIARYCKKAGFELPKKERKPKAEKAE